MFITWKSSLFLWCCEITVHRKLMASEATVFRLLSKFISIVQFSNKSLMARADSGPQKNLRFGSGQLAEKVWRYWHRPYLEIWTHFTSHLYSARISLEYGKKKRWGEGVAYLLPFPLFLYLNSWRPGNSPIFASGTAVQFFFLFHATKVE